MSIDSTLRPQSETELADIVRAHDRALEPFGGGSKRSIGRSVDADPLDLGALTGIIDYEPDELVVSACAATPLAELEATLAERGQRFAFEPPDFGRLLGVDAKPTIGGVLACNFAGSRRVAAGAARDHFLGLVAVDGRGQTFKAGGKVVKNVTGYDLPKLIAGSWGTLAVMSEVTLRVAPLTETERTLIVADDNPAAAVATMTAALGSAQEVSAAAFDPWRGTALRIEGFAASVDARAAALLAALEPAEHEALDGAASREFWHDIGAAAALADWPVVWRVSIPPADAPAVLASLEPERYVLDWGGGLVWAAYGRVDAARVRGAIRSGHATLIKAPEDARARTCVLHPTGAAVAAIAERVKRAFDPDGKLNPGRMD